jgi:hypothetical protein
VKKNVEDGRLHDAPEARQLEIGHREAAQDDEHD